MRTGLITLICAAAVTLLSSLRATGQDSPSLGDVARQTRLQKQKDAQGTVPSSSVPSVKNGPANIEDPAIRKDPKPIKRIITNDEIPEHVGPTSTRPINDPAVSYPQPYRYSGKVPAEQWQSQIQALKNQMAGLQQSIGTLAASIQYSGNDCVVNCVQWNERQKQKQEQLETMKAQLEQEQKTLEDMQDAARKQGYGTSVYDP
jgi:hypothetical protein